MKRLFKFKYPKLLLFIIAIILAYYIFTKPSIGNFISNLGTLGYLGVFIAGIFFGIGFTAPFATGFFIVLNPQNIWLAAIIGGLGSVAANLLIFRFIKITFGDEFKRLRNSKDMKIIGKLITENLGKKIKLYLLYIFAGITIALPLPDEIGILMLAGLTHIKGHVLGEVSFVLHAAGILFLLWV